MLTHERRYSDFIVWTFSYTLSSLLQTESGSIIQKYDFPKKKDADIVDFVILTDYR
jgi:hypothetical protein